MKKIFEFIKKNWKKAVAGCLLLLVISFIILYSFPIGRYLITQAWYQGKVIVGRRQISDMLKDSSTDEKIKDKLKLVGEIKKFGLDLGLKRSKTYTTVYDTGNQPAVWVVSACYKDRLQAVTWKFPLVGRMPYLGFFKKKDARAKFNELKEKGFDVLMRPVSAYSTGGYLPDPLYSNMLFGGEEYLANTIIHEMTHETIFLPNMVDFNESLASFVGNAGGVEFITKRYGADSDILKNTMAYKRDDEIFSEFMADLYDELKEFYAKDISREEKIKGREKIFEAAKERFKKEVEPRLETRGFEYFEKLKLNNAYVLFNRRYHKDYNVFDDLYRLQGSNLKKTIAFLKSVKNDKDIQKRINTEIEKLKKEKGKE